MPFSTPTDWRVFSTDPTPDADVLGGIAMASASKRYNCVYGNGSPACFTAGEVIPTGNALFYSFAPVLLVTPGAATSIYGNQTSVNGVQYADLTGFIDGDTAATAGLSQAGVFSTNATSASDVGTYNISYVSGLLSSLGYQFADNKMSTSEYAITPRSISLSSVSIADKTYDGSTTGRILGYGTLINIIPGDDVSATGGIAMFDSPTVDNNKLVMVTGASLTGAKAFDYVLTSTSITGVASINVLSNNFIGNATSGTTTTSTFSASSATSAIGANGSSSGSQGNSNASSNKSGSGDLAVDSGNGGGNVDTVSPTADASMVTIALTGGSAPAESSGDGFTVSGPSGLLVRADEAAKGGLIDAKSEINGLVTRRGLGVQISHNNTNKL
jgi:hypothetical protein